MSGGQVSFACRKSASLAAPHAPRDHVYSCGGAPCVWWSGVGKPKRTPVRGWDILSNWPSPPTTTMPRHTVGGAVQQLASIRFRLVPRAYDVPPRAVHPCVAPQYVWHPHYDAPTRTMHPHVDPQSTCGGSDESSSRKPPAPTPFHSIYSAALSRAVCNVDVLGLRQLECVLRVRRLRHGERHTRRLKQRRHP